MLHTTKLLSARFPTGIELIITSYVQAKKRDWKHVANAGEYETCLDIPQDNWNYGLYGACRGGHLELTMLMISKGATDWNTGLYGACRGGHLELARLMLSRGATKCSRCNKPVGEH